MAEVPRVQHGAEVQPLTANRRLYARRRTSQKRDVSRASLFRPRDEKRPQAEGEEVGEDGGAEEEMEGGGSNQRGRFPRSTGREDAADHVVVPVVWRSMYAQGGTVAQGGLGSPCSSSPPGRL